MSFLKACANFQNTVDAHNSKIFRKICFDMYAEIVKRSPVDTGYFRGNWRIGVNEVPRGTVERTRAHASKKGTKIKLAGGVAGGTVGEETGKIPQKIKDNTVVYLVNNVVYALMLERGWSRQAPAGVVGPSMNAILAALQGR